MASCHPAIRRQRSYTLRLLLIIYIERSISMVIPSSSTEYDCRELRDDVASKAVISPIIFEGRARRIETPPTWGTNPQNQKPFNVTFKPRTVYKGDLPRIEGGKDYASILVGQFGPAEDLNVCIPSVQIGSRYIVFLKLNQDRVAESEDMPYFDISQFPELTSKKAARHVIAYGCENCSFPPRIEPFIEVKVHLLTSQRLLLHCVTSGKPIPVVTWYRNGNPLIVTNSKRINIKNKRDGSSLDIEKVVSQDSGLYRCNAKNILGEVLSDPVDVNITPSELEFCSSQGYCLNGGHCYIVPKTGRKICECQKNFTGIRCQEPNLMEHFLIMKQTYEFFERRLEGLVMTSILLIIILILLFFISIVCISRRKSECKSHGCKQISNVVHQSSASAWNDSSVQTDRHYENVHMNQQPISPRNHDVTTAISPENSARLSWMEKPHNHTMVVSSEACVIVGNQPPKPSGVVASVVPNKLPVEFKNSKCDECKTEDVSKRCSSVFIETKDQLEMKTFRNQSEIAASRCEDGKDAKSKNAGCKMVNRDSGIDVRASRVTTSETIQANELLDLRLSEEMVGCCEINGINNKEDVHIYSNTPLEVSVPAPRPTVVEILEQLRNNNDLQLVTPNKLSSIFQACKEKEKLPTKSAKDVSCGCPENLLSNVRTQDEKQKAMNLAPNDKNNKRLSCNVEVQTDKRCKELILQNKSKLQKRKSCYVISSAINGVVFTEIEKAENSGKNLKNKRGNATEPLNSVAEEDKFNIKLGKPEKRKSDKGLKVSIDAKPLKNENDEIKSSDLPAKYLPSYQEVLRQCGNSLSDYKLNQKDLKLYKKRSESAFPFSGKEANQEHNAPDRSKHGVKEYVKHRANSTSTDNSTSYNNFPQRNSKILETRPKTSSPIPNGHFQFFPNSQNDKDFVSPPIPAKKFASHFVKENDRFSHRIDSKKIAHQMTDHQSKVDKYFSPPSIPIKNSRVSKIPLRNHEDCHPLVFTNSKFQLNSNSESDVLIAEDGKKPHHPNASDLSSAEITSKASPQGDGSKSSFRQSPLQSVAGIRNAFENMSSNYKITSPSEQSGIPKTKQSYRYFSNQLSSMIPVKDSAEEVKDVLLEAINIDENVSETITNCEVVGNEYDALYSTDERSVSCSECDCRVSQASDLEVNRESEVDILTLNASEEELLDLQQNRRGRINGDKSIPATRDKFRNKYLSGSTFAKKCVELCKENSLDKNERLALEMNGSKQEIRGKLDGEGERVTGEILSQYRHAEEYDKKDSKSAPVASSDEYGESSADSSESEDSSISSNEAERGIDMLFERLKLDHGDDLLAAVEAMQSQKESVSSTDRVIEFPSFDWDKAPCCPFSFESLDRTFTLNPYDLMYAHKYVASQNRVDEPEVTDGAFVGATGISSPFRKNGELGLPSPKFQFDFDSDTTVA